MRLNAIVSLSKEQHNEYQEIFDKLKEKFPRENIKFPGIDKNKVIESCDRKSGYAHYTCTGKLKDGVKISELELSMVIDNGFSYFGGSSNICNDGSFSVTIDTD